MSYKIHTKFYPSKRGKIGNCTAVLLQCSDGERRKVAFGSMVWCWMEKNNKTTSSYRKGKRVQMEMVLDPWSLTWGLANNPKEAPSIALGGGGPSEKSREAETPSAPSRQRFPRRFLAVGIHGGLASYNARLLSYPPALRVSALGTRSLQGEPPATRLGTLNQEWTLGGGPLLQGWQDGLGQAVLG